jgi:hypothetical protein
MTLTINFALIFSNFAGIFFAHRVGSNCPADNSGMNRFSL